MRKAPRSLARKQFKDNKPYKGRRRPNKASKLLDRYLRAG